MSEARQDSWSSTPGSVPQPGYVRGNADLIAMLPEPGPEWMSYRLEARDDVHPVLAERFSHVQNELASNHVIHKQGMKYAGGTDMVVWKTDRPSYRMAVNLREQRDLLPCDHHAGFDTLEVGRYRCGFRWCERIYDRETVSEVFG